MNMLSEKAYKFSKVAFATLGIIGTLALTSVIWIEFIDKIKGVSPIILFTTFAAIIPLMAFKDFKL